jgi:hypothetical protein
MSTRLLSFGKDFRLLRERFEAEGDFLVDTD